MDAIVYDKVGKEAEKVRNALYGIYPKETITDAEIASFADGADGIPVEKLVVNIEPVQDLHGYDHPWPAGGGKNKLNPEVARASTYYNSQGQALGNPSWSVYLAKVEGLNTVTISGIDKPDSGTYFVWLSGKDVISDVVGVIGNHKNYNALTVPNDAKYIGMSFINNSSSASYDLDTAQVENGSTATSYEPYSNICPISGHTGAEIVDAGESLLDYINYISNGNNGWYTNPFKVTDGITSCYINIFDVGSYTGSIILACSANGVDYTDFFTTYPQDVAIPYHASPSIPEGTKYVRVRGYQSNHDTLQSIKTVKMVVSKQRVDEYVPCNRKDISVIFPTTVYGGTLDLETGELVATWASRQIKNFPINGGNGSFFYTSTAEKAFGVTNIISSIYKTVDTSASEMPQCSIKGHGSNKNIYIMDTRYQTGAELIAAEGDEWIAFELATPITYTLTAEQVSGILETIYGQNNIWADTGNIKKLTYRADLGKYIDSHITTAVANTLNA